MKTYLEIGVGITPAGRSYSYNPAGLERGDAIVCIDPAKDKGSRGQSALVRGQERPMIYPNSALAKDYIDNHTGDAAETNSASAQYESNLAFEERCRRFGIMLAQTFGDGRHLVLPEDSVDEVFMANVIGDKAINQKDTYRIILEAIRVVGQGNVLLLENYTPWVAEKRINTIACIADLAVTTYDYEPGIFRATREPSIDIAKDMPRLSLGTRSLQGSRFTVLKRQP